MDTTDLILFADLIAFMIVVFVIPTIIIMWMLRAAIRTGQILFTTKSRIAKK